MEEMAARQRSSGLGLLQPLGVLVKHGIDDVDEGLVGGKEAVAAGEHVAFEPAFERVLAQHLHHAAVGRDVGAVGIFGLDALPSRFSGWLRRWPGAGSTRFRRGRRRGSWSGLLRMTSAQRICARISVGPTYSVAGLFYFERRSRGNPACAAACVAKPPFACGLALMRRSCLREQARAVPAWAARLSSNNSSGLIAAQPFFQELQMLGILAAFEDRDLMSAPESLRACGRRLLSGRSSLWAMRSTIMGQRGHPACRR